jgi:hypothetical protein
MTIPVTGATSGSYTVSASPSNGGAAGATATATLRVIEAPQATAVMVPGQVAEYGQAHIVIGIVNPNDIDIPGLSFTLTAPGDLQVAFWEGPECGATMSPQDFAKTVTVTGATLPANGECGFSVLVTTHPEGQYTFSTSSIKFQYGSIPGVSASLTVGGLAPGASLVTVDATPSPSPSPAAPSDNPSRHLTPAAAAATIGGGSGLPTVALGVGGVAVLGLAGLLALVWRRRRTPAVEVMYQRMGKVSRGALPFLAAGALVLGAAALVLAAGASLSKIAVTGTPSGSHTVSASPSNSGAAGASANSSETNAPVVTMKVTPDPEGEDGQAWLTIAIENTNEDEDIHGVSFTLTGPENLQVAPGEVSPQCGGPDVMRGSTSQEVTVTRATVPAHTTCSFTMLITVDYHGDYTFSTGPIGSGYGSSPGVSGTFELPVAEATATPTAAPAAATTGGDSGLPTAALGVGGLALLGLGGVLTLVWRRRRTPAKEVV